MNKTYCIIAEEKERKCMLSFVFTDLKQAIEYKDHYNEDYIKKGYSENTFKVFECIEVKNS
jgi:hypothetical protein